MLNVEDWKVYPWIQEQGHVVGFHHCYNMVLEILPRAMRKNIKGIHIWKEKVKPCLFTDTDDSILYVSKESTEKLFELVN